MRLRDFSMRLGVTFLVSSVLTAAGGAHAAKQSNTAFKNGRQNFESTVRLIKEKYYRAGLSDDEIYEAATRGLLEFLQPDNNWDKLLTGAEYEEMMRGLDGKVSGIGIVLSYSEKSGTADVVQVLAGTPAASAGLQPGDRILRVDGKTFKNQPFINMVASIRGESGRPVVLALLRDSSVIEKRVTRSSVSWDTASGQIIDGVGVLTVRAFSKNTPELAKEALRQFKDKNARGLVIDLRGNTGGSLESALEVMDLFTSKGQTLVRMTGRDGQVDVRTAKDDSLLSETETAVLIDNQTSCGAELLAAVLKKYRQATFVGEKTAGKWSVQRVERIANGFAVKYTTALLAPGEGAEDVTGPDHTAALAPDIEVQLTEGEEPELLSRIQDLKERLANDAQLRAALQVVN